jgi:hypothetical protein
MQLSTLAVRLGEITSLPVIELDKLSWRPDLTATPRDQFAAIQRELAAHESWIMDGDLGPYDVLDVRPRAADTVVFMDFSPARCAWRAIRRSRERADFWWWLLSRRGSRRLKSRPGPTCGKRSRHAPPKRPPEPLDTKRSRYALVSR